ncbi:uncharacterized protein LOC126252872 [Schistocerca nitens]|uniref:uncharacterized protein LOC126252872 n=1 Tax=Schistocerca nitens TaxID=7011 RepID=UPI002119428C|nr:uncharacterized protein LOC126252872 [Schistocerca nitens]
MARHRSSAPAQSESAAPLPLLLLLTLPALLSVAGAAPAPAPPAVDAISIESRAIRPPIPQPPDYQDYQSAVRYDEYPVVVPKRTALLLDRLMVDLKHLMDKDRGEAQNPIDSGSSIGRMALQRRGQKTGQYWRCYFNAVTCFRRK